MHVQRHIVYIDPYNKLKKLLNNKKNYCRINLFKHLSISDTAYSTGCCMASETVVSTVLLPDYRTASFLRQQDFDSCSALYHNNSFYGKKNNSLKKIAKKAKKNNSLHFMVQPCVDKWQINYPWTLNYLVIIEKNNSGCGEVLHEAHVKGQSSKDHLQIGRLNTWKQAVEVSREQWQVCSCLENPFLVDTFHTNAQTHTHNHTCCNHTRPHYNKLKK